MQTIDVSHSQGHAVPPAPIAVDDALAASLRVNVLTLDMRARLALINGALRALRGLGVMVAALDLHPLAQGLPRIDLGVISRQQADQVLGVADASTRDTDRQLYSATAYGVRLVWGIPR